MIAFLRDLAPDERRILEDAFIRAFKQWARNSRGLNVRLPGSIRPPRRACFFEYQLGQEAGGLTTRERSGGVQVPAAHFGVLTAHQLFLEYWSDPPLARGEVHEYLINRNDVATVNPAGTITHPADLGLGVTWLCGDVSFRSGSTPGVPRDHYVVVAYGHAFYRVQNDRDAGMADLAYQRFYGNGEPWWTAHVLLDGGDRHEFYRGDGVTLNTRVTTWGIRGWIAPYQSKTEGPARFVQE